MGNLLTTYLRNPLQAEEVQALSERSHIATSSSLQVDEDPGEPLNTISGTRCTRVEPPTYQLEGKNVDNICPVCKEILHVLGSYKVNDRFSDKGYLNWLKACLALQYAKEAMEQFTEEKIRELHKSLLQNVKDSVISNTGSYNECEDCEFKTKKNKCPKDVCDVWRDKIVACCVGRQINWKKTNIKDVKKNPWDLAKVFQRDGCENHKGPENADMSALLGLVLRCTYFKTYVNDMGLVNKVRDIRNSLFHSENMKIVDETTLRQHIEAVLDLLDDPEDLKNQERCQRMVKKIKRLRDKKERPGLEEEHMIFSEHVTCMKEKRNAQQDLLKSAETIEEFKEVQRKIKKIEDKSQRLGFFLDMNTIDEPEMRQDLSDINATSREIYIEAERNLVRMEIKKENERLIREKMPGKPMTSNVRLDSLELTWEKPECVMDQYCYDIRYRDVTSGDGWKHVQAKYKDNRAVLTNLKGNTAFVFQVRMIQEDDVGPYGEQSDAVSTVISAGGQLSHSANIYKPGTPTVYTLPLNEIKAARNEAAKLRKFEFGVPSPTCARKTILLVGETGKGKTSVVNGLANYILGVNWDDPYRFSVGELDRSSTTKESTSATDWITQYTIHPADGCRIDYTLTIIDTPGFGNTQGLQRDQEVVDQIHTLISANKDYANDGIDAVCIVIDAHESRLTATQKYILNKLLSLFSRSLEKNVCSLISVMNEEDIAVTKTLDEIKCPLGKLFVICSSCLFTNNADMEASTFSPMFWKLYLESYNSFLNYLKDTQTETLLQTKEVLDDRKKLRETFSSLEKKRQKQLSAKRDKEKAKEKVKLLQNEVDSNKEFEYEVDEIHHIPIGIISSSGQVNTYCLHCNHTCHESCAVEDNDQKKSCCVMKDGYCTVCPAKCYWDQHKNTQHRYENSTYKIKKINYQMKSNYEMALSRLGVAKKEVERMETDISVLDVDIDYLIKEIKHINDHLQQTAMLPCIGGVVDYIDLLVESEKMEKKDGYTERISSLMVFRKMAEEIENRT